MTEQAVGLLAALARVQSWVTLVVLAALFSLGLRSLALVFFVDKKRGWPVRATRMAAGVAFLGLGTFYWLFTASSVDLDLMGVALMLATGALLASGVFLRRILRRTPSRPGTVQVLVQAVALLSLLLVACLTLMRAGFLALTTDEAVLLVEVTGDTGHRRVRWAPPNKVSREEDLATHRVVFRTPQGRPVAEAWIYGDQVAVKGRVLRLSPLLNAAGVSNLFELSYVHNGYLTFERNALFPHQSQPLELTGPLAVHPWWRPLQRRLLGMWEKGSDDGSAWMVRSSTTESTYFPLVDSAGRPVKHVYRVVLTPGGLTSS